MAKHSPSNPFENSKNSNSKIENFIDFDNTVATSDENVDPVTLMNEVLEKKEAGNDANASILSMVDENEALY